MSYLFFSNFFSQINYENLVCLSYFPFSYFHLFYFHQNKQWGRYARKDILIPEKKNPDKFVAFVYKICSGIII